MGICPKCQNEVRTLTVHAVDAYGIGHTLKGVVYVCPHCSVVLGAGLDPLALQSDTVSAIAGHVTETVGQAIEALRTD